MNGLFTAWQIPGAAQPHAQIRQPGAGIERSHSVFRPQLLLWSGACDREEKEPVAEKPLQTGHVPWEVPVRKCQVPVP